ncbi:hypothetical protein AB4Z52_33370 [Rhizobium sp. 2YAF20]|uniref:hypothetical protein n=1 Tax=Rhizobium sp. 2YAF20 TaxID=3233027 RepID=UPI003F949302
MERRTKTEITFAYPFVLGAIAKPFEPGTYVVTVDEEPIEGLSLAAFRKTATHLEVPAIGITNAKRQFLAVSGRDLEEAVARDRARTTVAG